MKSSYFQLLTPQATMLWLIAQPDRAIASLQNRWSNLLRSNIMSLAKVVKVQQLPTVISLPIDRSLQLLKAPLRRMFPEATVVSQSRAIDTWDELNVMQAMQATGRKQVILAGVSTGGCLYFPAISALQMGYDVWVVYDTVDYQDAKFDLTTLSRLQEAGCEVCQWAMIFSLLQGDEPTTPTNQPLKLLDEHWRGNVSAINFKPFEAS